METILGPTCARACAQFLKLDKAWTIWGIKTSFAPPCELMMEGNEEMHIDQITHGLIDGEEEFDRTLSDMRTH